MALRARLNRGIEVAAREPLNPHWCETLRNHLRDMLVPRALDAEAAAAAAAQEDAVEPLRAPEPEEEPREGEEEYQPGIPEVEFPDYDTTLNDTTGGAGFYDAAQGADAQRDDDHAPHIPEPDAAEGEDTHVTAEEYSQTNWSERTQKVLNSLKLKFDAEPDQPLQYSKLAGRSRRTAAVCLFELLVLKTRDFIEVDQEEPFGDITVTPTDKLLDYTEAAAASTA